MEKRKKGREDEETVYWLTDRKQNFT
jgi:hypothetical protein